MTTAVQVPTSGFNVPPIPGTPQAQPQQPTQQQQGFYVPPAGGAPIASHDQNPGWLQQPTQQPQPQQVQQTPQPAQGQPDLTNIVAMLQEALGKSEQGTAQTAGGELNTFDVKTIQDPMIQSMASVLQGAAKGIDLDRVMQRALQHGDPSLIDFAYLREAAGEQAPQLQALAQNIVRAVQAKADEVERGVYAEVGGEEIWHASVAAFNKSAPHELRVTVKQMLDSQNEQFIKAGAKIVAQFGQQSGAVPQPANLMGSTSAGASFNQHGLSKADFQAELRKLDQNAPNYEQQREALFVRRAAGKRAGLN